MGHWPKTVGGNLVVLVLGVILASVFVESAIALSGVLSRPSIWVSLLAIALTVVTLTIWRSRVQAARDLAVADAPSFGDVLRARNAAQAL